VAGISARIMGDECTDDYYWCAACQVYTIRLCREMFAGPDVVHDSDPIPKEEGERRLAIIRACVQPGDERCRCEAHRAYFGDWLD
jgi:hypothetical protein